MEFKSIHREEKSKAKQIKKFLSIKIAADQPSANKKSDINDRVSDYISRAKIRIRTMSLIGGGKDKVEEESAPSTKHFTDYIRRTKCKLRSRTSSISDGKSIISSRKNSEI